MSTDVANKPAQSLAQLLRTYSAEVVPSDSKSLQAAATLLPSGSEVFIAALPNDPPERQIDAAIRLSRAGLQPVPHLVARNLRNLAQFDTLIARLTQEAGVQRALLLAGDRPQPAGEVASSLQLLQSGVLGKYGIRRVALSAYPEGHPRIAAADLLAARAAKLKLAAQLELQVVLVSQFCFEAAPIIALARELRRDGWQAPLRVGVAGPASRTALLKYALLCGVGASIRALKERPGARSMLAGESARDVLTEIALAQADDPALRVEGVHFFTFGSLAATVQFVANCRTALRD